LFIQASILFITSEEAEGNLLKEEIPKEKIHFVGNVMVESLLKYRYKAEQSRILEKLNLNEKGYALVTLHRPSNVDQRETFKEILEALYRIGKEIDVVFPAHPRAQKRMKEFGFQNLDGRIIITNPVGYLDFLALEMNARFVLTDSGGVQEETTFFHVPCLTIRENTERPITVTRGTNTLVGTDSNTIVRESLNILNGKGKEGDVPEFWDDKVSERVVQTLQTYI